MPLVNCQVCFGHINQYTLKNLQVATVGTAGTPEYLPGIRVPEVVRGSVADLAGFRAGDLILKVNDAPVLSEPNGVSKLVNQIKRSDGKPMKFDVVRGQESLQVLCATLHAILYPKHK